jgi:hypothetical protein
VGLQSQQPDIAFKNIWPSKLHGDTGDWLFVPEVNKPVEVKFKAAPPAH